MDVQDACLEASFEAMHGHAGDPSWEAPLLVVQCDEEARPGYESCKANEYVDTPDVLAAKIRLFADLVRRSHNCVAYTGAGISTASGIDDYATRAGAKSIAKQGAATAPKSPLDAMPTLAHRVMAQMYHAGHLKYWIQQNHDGLPQKAGYPQHAINEIHGAWFDPSNPVVPMSGQLRTDLFDDLLQWEQNADLVLAMGTSMCGMNADRVAVTCAQRSRRQRTLGTIIVGIQCTQHDALSTLRIFARIDDVMQGVATELGLTPAPAMRPSPSLVCSPGLEVDMYYIPYDMNGAKLPSDETPTLVDLRANSVFRVTMGPYQGNYGLVTGKNRLGHYTLIIYVPRPPTKVLSPIPRILGSWWPKEAVEGTAPYFPVVNCPVSDELPELLLRELR